MGEPPPIRQGRTDPLIVALLIVGLAIVVVGVVAIQYRPPGHGPASIDVRFGSEGLDISTRDAPLAERPRRPRRRPSSSKA